MKTGLEDSLKVLENELVEYTTNYQDLLKKQRRTRQGSDRYYELNGELSACIFHIAILAESLHELREEHTDAEDQLEALQEERAAKAA